MFWKKPDFLQDYAHRFVSIRHIAIPKKASKIEKKEPINDSPNKAWKFDWPHNLQFGQLARI